MFLEMNEIFHRLIFYNKCAKILKFLKILSNLSKLIKKTNLHPAHIHTTLIEDCTFQTCSFSLRLCFTLCCTFKNRCSFFTLSHRRFLHAVIYKAARDANLPRSIKAITNNPHPVGVQGMVGGHTMPAGDASCSPPRHAGRWIVPDDGFAAEKPGGG